MSLPPITSVMLILTHACNLNCRYCFVHQEPSHMTLKTAMDAARFIIKNAEESGQTPSINFFGGEPMLMWDTIIVPLTKWIRQAYKKPFNLSMTTNGTLLNDERIEFMKDNKIGILFSIDGAKKTQDYNRPYHNGMGSFDSLEHIITKIRINFPNTTFRMTAIPETCGYLFENIMFAERNGFKSFFVMPNVFQEWNDEQWAMLSAEVHKFGDYYISCYQNGVKPITFSTFESAFDDIKLINGAITAQHYRVRKKCKSCGKCGLGATRFASIHPNGNVYGCQEMTSNEGEKSIFYIGNIYTGIEENRRSTLMDAFDSEPVTGADCVRCKYNRICDGGCVANNYLATGSLTKMPVIQCKWRQLLLAEAIRVMQALGEEQNEKFREKWVKKK